MGGSRLPGPICTIANDYFVGPETTCVSPSYPPGPDLGERSFWDETVEATTKKKYQLHAEITSYAMQAESVIGGKDKPSILGGKFLRMYLDHKLDHDAVKEAGEEIEASKMWESLKSETTARIQEDVTRNRRLPSDKEVADIARKFLKNKLKKGIAFRGALNSVVGGVRDIVVAPKAEFLNQKIHDDETTVEFVLKVTLFDTYDFSNKRDGEYAAYRTRLAKLLKKNQFCEFEKAYWGEMCPGPKGPRTRLNSKAVLFASFMYALEQRGWTPGALAWDVTIPMTGTFTQHSKERRKVSAAHSSQ